MYNVLIVDDEILAVRFLEHLTDWGKLNCRVAGTAATVTRALELVEELQPDLIFMDIKMPGMDGIELSSRILAENCHTEIIILTAYPDFQFAQEALRLGVQDFLIKHELDEMVLCETVTKVLKKIEKKNQIAQMVIKNWLKDGWDNQVQSEVPDLLSGEQRLYRILLVKNQSVLGKPEDTTVREEEWKAQQKVAGWFVEKKEFAVFLIEIGREKSQIQRREAYFLLADRIASQWKQYTGLSGITVYSEEFKGIQQYRSSCEALRRIQKYMFFLPHRVVFPEDYEGLPVVEPVWPQELSERLRRCILSGSEKTEHLLNEIFPGRQRDFLVEEKTLVQMKKDVREGSVLYMIQTFGELLWRQQELKQALEQEAAFEGNSMKVRQAVAFIQEHFGEDLSSSVIADSLMVSDGYLRRIFKQEMGMTVKDYLSEYRMKKAMEYLQTGAYKISRIARLCGYKSSQHFSTVFKNTTGQTPGEYTSDKKIHE